MKIKFLIPIIAVILIAMACDPIEDKSARDEFAKTGTPISVKDLNAALSVTQPVHNSNQYVVLHNSRTDIPGTWFVQTPTGTVQRHTDHDTIVYNANKTYEIYFVGLSEKEAVTSDIFYVTVTDLPVDIYENFLTGAETASDLTAKKTWKLLNHPLAFYNGMYGAWKYYDMTPGQSNYQGGASVLTADDYGKTMVFEFGGNKVTIYDKNGAVLSTGGWSSNHENRGEEINGELNSTIALIATEKRWQDFNGTKTPYFILKIDAKNMILCLPETYNRTGDDWDYDASYYFFTVVE